MQELGPYAQSEWKKAISSSYGKLSPLEQAQFHLKYERRLQQCFMTLSHETSRTLDADESLIVSYCRPLSEVSLYNTSTTLRQDYRLTQVYALRAFARPVFFLSTIRGSRMSTPSARRISSAAGPHLELQSSHPLPIYLSW
jgi:hypothetical protein